MAAPAVADLVNTPASSLAVQRRDVGLYLVAIRLLSRFQVDSGPGAHLSGETDHLDAMTGRVAPTAALTAVDRCQDRCAFLARRLAARVGRRRGQRDGGQREECGRAKQGLQFW